MGGGQPELLCIDDDEQSLIVRKLLLENHGFRVRTANSGKEGIKAFKAHAVDGVVCDYQMPDLDGGQVAEELKRLDPSVPVMILSALPYLPENAPSCIDAFVSKGESTAMLASRINHMLAAGTGAARKPNWLKQIVHRPRLPRRQPQAMAGT